MFFFNYQDSIDNPLKSAKLIAKKLNLKFSDKTFQILKKIKTPKSNLKIKKDLIKRRINNKILRLIEKTQS